MSPRKLNTLLFTIEEAAFILRCSYGTLHKWIKEGKVATVVLGKRDRRIPDTEIKRLLYG